MGLGLTVPEAVSSRGEGADVALNTPEPCFDLPIILEPFSRVH